MSELTSGILDGIKKNSVEHKCRTCDADLYYEPKNGECEVCVDKRASKERRYAALGVSNRHRYPESYRDYVNGNKAAESLWGFWSRANEAGVILLLAGKRGTGKTQAMSTLVMEHCRKPNWACLRNCYQVCGDLKARFDREYDAEGSWIEAWCNAPILCIDEIQDQPTDFVRDSLTRLIDDRYRRMLTTVLAGNVTKAGAPSVLGASVVSRANEGGPGWCFEFDWDSLREKRLA